MSSTTFPLTYLLGSVTAGAATGVTTGTSKWMPVTGGPQDVTITFTSVGTTSGGTILLEETDDPYNGLSVATASQLYSQAASGFSGNLQLCVHTRLGAGMFLRARISSTITGGGTIVVSMVGS